MFRVLIVTVVLKAWSCVWGVGGGRCGVVYLKDLNILMLGIRGIN